MSTATEPQTVMLPMVAAINRAIDEAMTKDPRVIVLGEDVADSEGGGVYKATMGLSTTHGTDRVRSTPISEQAIVGAAIGAAIAGFRPIAEIMMFDFIAVAMDQVCNHAAKLRYMSGSQTAVPITIRCSAGAGMQFGAQHSDMLEAWLCHVPGLKVVIPSNPADAKGLLTSCIFDEDPCVFVEQTMSYFLPGPVPVGEHVVPLGQAAVRREGTDLTIVSYGRQVNDCLRASDALAQDGIEAEVLDLRSLVPLDLDRVLTSVAKTRRALVVHEAVTRCGFGAELSAQITEHLFDSLAGPVARLGAKNVPVPYSMPLERAYLPGRAEIVDAARRVVEH